MHHTNSHICYPLILREKLPFRNILMRSRLEKIGNKMNEKPEFFHSIHIIPCDKTRHCHWNHNICSILWYTPGTIISVHNLKWNIYTSFNFFTHQAKRSLLHSLRSAHFSLHRCNVMIRLKVPINWQKNMFQHFWTYEL